MARSMTGYGFGVYDLYNRKVTVEIKSVNSKFQDISIKLPKIINIYENDIKSIINEEISRGKVDVYINIISNSSEDIDIRFDDDLLEKYFEVFDKINDKYNVDLPNMSDIINLEGVISKESNINNVDTLAEIWETLFVALNSAISTLVKTREDEGEILKNDILHKIIELYSLIEEIKEISPIINEEYKNRLSSKIEEHLKSINMKFNDKELEQRIITEICIFSEKTDIDEEIVRFYANLESLKNTLLKETVIGKKVDFILQELNREVNTISSKSNDIRLSKNCISIKIILEKIREQAKNIE